MNGAVEFRGDQKATAAISKVLVESINLASVVVHLLGQGLEHSKERREGLEGRRIGGIGDGGRDRRVCLARLAIGATSEIGRQ